MKTETCPDCKAEYDAAYSHTCRDTKCAFCRKEGDEFTWAISFGNMPLMGKEAVDYVCPDCIIDGFYELEKLRKLARQLQAIEGWHDCFGDAANDFMALMDAHAKEFPITD